MLRSVLRFDVKNGPRFLKHRLNLGPQPPVGPSVRRDHKLQRQNHYSNQPRHSFPPGTRSYRRSSEQRYRRKLPILSLETLWRLTFPAANNPTSQSVASSHWDAVEWVAPVSTQPISPNNFPSPMRTGDGMSSVRIDWHSSADRRAPKCIRR